MKFWNKSFRGWDVKKTYPPFYRHFFHNVGLWEKSLWTPLHRGLVTFNRELLHCDISTFTSVEDLSFSLSDCVSNGWFHAALWVNEVSLKAACDPVISCQYLLDSSQKHTNKLPRSSNTLWEFFFFSLNSRYVTNDWLKLRSPAGSPAASCCRQDTHVRPDSCTHTHHYC